ncbi:hypothetical protein KBJ94_19730 [Pseudomonas sp. ITA]|nr:hypothetical protein [Pseudomonas sp. ITA]MDI2144281.1 hypothetical protein [Pseudomonas sp. ITA]
MYSPIIAAFGQIPQNPLTLPSVEPDMAGIAKPWVTGMLLLLFLLRRKT